MVLYLHVFQYINSAPIIKLNSPTLVQRSYLVNIIMSYKLFQSGSGEPEISRITPDKWRIQTDFSTAHPLE